MIIFKTDFIGCNGMSKNKRFGAKAPSLKQLQAAMNYGKPAGGIVNPPEFMVKKKPIVQEHKKLASK